MLTTQKVRHSRRLATKPRVDYSKYFKESDSTETSENEMEQEGSISSIEAYDVSTTPKSVLKQINTVKKMRLASGNPGAVVYKRRSARIASKMQDEVDDVMINMGAMKIDPEAIGANSGSLFKNEPARPEFIEPLTPVEATHITATPNKQVDEIFTALLFNISTTKDLYGDIIKISKMIEEYPYLITESQTQESLRLIGKYMSVKFLADEQALKSYRSHDISNAISFLLAM